MYAFTTPAPIGRYWAPQVGASVLKSSICALPQRLRASPSPRWISCAEPIDEMALGIEQGQELRNKLSEVSENRRSQAKRTNEALLEMAKQISAITAKLRADAGMPPVAEPPSDRDPAEAPPRQVLAEDESSSVADEPYTDPKNFGYEATAGWQVLQASDDLPENEGNLQFKIECDMHGCSLIQVKGDAPAGPGVRQKFIQAGTGFRIGYDPEAPKSFCAMVGNDQWLTALNYDEIRHFKRLCLSLQKRMDRIGRGEEDPPAKKPAVRRSGDGMFNMRVARAGLDCSVELESKLVWAQAIGQPVLGQYCIRAIFMESRQTECFWDIETAPLLLTALGKIGIE